MISDCLMEQRGQECMGEETTFDLVLNKKLRIFLQRGSESKMIHCEG